MTSLVSEMGIQCNNFSVILVNEILLTDTADFFKNMIIFKTSYSLLFSKCILSRGWLGGAMVLGKLPVPGRPTIWKIVGQGPIALAVGAGGSCFDIFTLLYPFSPFSPPLRETARYRLKYCLKGLLNQKQPTNV